MAGTVAGIVSPVPRPAGQRDWLHSWLRHHWSLRAIDKTPNGLHQPGIAAGRHIRIVVRVQGSSRRSRGEFIERARNPGRRRSDITLIAVTKVFPAGRILEAYELGLRHFGENYVQEFEGKAPEVQSSPRRSFSPYRPPAIEQEREGRRNFPRRSRPSTRPNSPAG